MPLGSAATSKIDIDFTRAQGAPSSGQIIFKPKRTSLGSTVISPFPIVVDVVEGIGSVDLVRLPFGTYQVQELIDGGRGRPFSFSLPTSSPDVIQYETIVPVEVVPTYFTSVKTINGVSPDPTTGNIVVEGGGGVVPDATTTIKGIIRLAGDLAGSADAPSLSAGRIAELNGKYVKPSGGIPSTDMTEPVQAALIAALTAVQPAELETVAESIPTSKADLGLSNVDNTSDLNKPVSTATETAIEAAVDALVLLPPDRIIRVADRSKTAGAVNTYNMPNTGGAWALFTGGPAEWSMPASIGDDIDVDYSYLIDFADFAFTDLAVVTGGTPTPQRYLASNSSTPAFSGAAGNYPSGAGLEGRSGSYGFGVEASDLDSGLVRIRFVVKTNTDNGKMYANNNYPLLLCIRNTRLSGL